jgi:hypothetical protein
MSDRRILLAFDIDEAEAIRDVSAPQVYAPLDAAFVSR